MNVFDVGIVTWVVTVTGASVTLSWPMGLVAYLVVFAISEDRVGARGAAGLSFVLVATCVGIWSGVFPESFYSFFLSCFGGG